jgi:hypothetical protein
MHPSRELTAASNASVSSDEMDAPTAETAPVKPSRETKNDSSEKSEAAKGTQLEAVEAMTEERGLTDKFEKFFLPVERYNFMDPDDAPDHWELTADAQGSLLLLGQNKRSRTWAYLTSRNDRGKTQLIFLNVPIPAAPAAPADDIKSEGDSLAGSAVKVENLEEMSLMYPFQIFKLMKTSKSLNQLKHLVKYVYLVTRTVAQVFEVDVEDNFKTAKDVLEKAIDALERYYDKHSEFRVYCSRVSSVADNYREFKKRAGTTGPRHQRGRRGHQTWRELSSTQENDKERN